MGDRVRIHLPGWTRKTRILNDYDVDSDDTGVEMDIVPRTDKFVQVYRGQQMSNPDCTGGSAGFQAVCDGSSFNQPFCSDGNPSYWKCDNSDDLLWNHSTQVLSLQVRRAVAAGDIAGFRVGTFGSGLAGQSVLAAPDAGVPASGHGVQVQAVVGTKTTPWTAVSVHALGAAQFSLSYNPATPGSATAATWKITTTTPIGAGRRIIITEMFKAGIFCEQYDAYKTTPYEITNSMVNATGASGVSGVTWSGRIPADYNTYPTSGGRLGFSEFR